MFKKKHPNAHSFKKITILFTHFGDDAIRGSERCLLDLIKHIDKRYFTPIVWCNQENLATEVRLLGIKVIVTNFPILFSWFDSRYDFYAFYQVIKQGLAIIKQENITLIHANGGAPNQWLHIIARIKKLPLLAQLHSRYPLRDRATLGLLYPSITIGVSHPIINQFKSDQVAHNKLKVISNGIDINFQDEANIVDIRKALKLTKNSMVIMTTASLIHRKGIDIIIEALFYINKSHPNVHLVIAGDGPDKSLLINMAKAFHLQHRIHFLGETKNIAGILRGGVDIFVSAAREEVFGLVLAEANLAKIPVVATHVGGIPEVIKHLETGILVANENSLAIAEAIKSLIENPKLRSSIGLTGRNNIIKKFNIEKNVLRFQYTYLSLILNKSTHLSWFKSWHIILQIKMILKGFALIRHKKIKMAALKRVRHE